jgi:prophage maintenance system killer protein
MRYLTVEEVLELHARLLEQSGGSEGLRDLKGSAI